MRVLIVEDEVTLSSTLAEGLKELGYQSDIAENFKDADYYTDIRNYDLILLDWMLPDNSGLELIPIAKERNPKTIIIVLSARDDKEIELKGKPFEVLTHLARHKDQIVSKEQLLDAIWEEPELVTPNVIEVAINQIRQKLDKPLGIQTIETVRRKGYRFCYPSKA